MDGQASPLRRLVDELGLSTEAFRLRLAELGHDVDSRKLRRWLAPKGLPSTRAAPEWLLAIARRMAGKGIGSEWTVGTDEIGRRVVVHSVAPRFAALMHGRGKVEAIDWWDAAEDDLAWAEAARLASERAWHRAYRERQPGGTDSAGMAK